MKGKNSLVWQQVAYYAPFLSEEGIAEAMALIEASRRSIRCSSIVEYIPCDEDEGDVMHSSITELAPCAQEAEIETAPLNEEEREEKRSKEETEMLLSELRSVVNRLRLEGYSLRAIHDLIDKRQMISRMVITADYRIFLPDYNNMEIEMTALPKALFLLFLRYPEGIVLKELQDHYGELLNIYRQLRPSADTAKMAVSVTKLVNPLSNAINENLARIRKAFVEKFDEHLSKNYIVQGTPGAAYSVSLDRDLIIWQE